jgi:PAS domain-containing protein
VARSFESSAPISYLTERKRAEAALHESEERLTLAFAGAQEGVWDWNLDTGAVVYSAGWKQMLGYAEDEIEPHVSAWDVCCIPTTCPAPARSTKA